MQPTITTRTVRKRTLTVNLATWKQLDTEAVETSSQIEEALQMAAWAVAEMKKSRRQS